VIAVNFTFRRLGVASGSFRGQRRLRSRADSGFGSGSGRVFAELRRPLHDAIVDQLCQLRGEPRLARRAHARPGGGAVGVRGDRMRGGGADEQGGAVHIDEQGSSANRGLSPGHF
jgi:hypothetical protein